MKKRVVKYWTFNLLSGLVLYLAYRITITTINATGDGLSATILQILEIALNLGFSVLYLGAMVLCSFTIFLNFIKKIRDSYFLSWLSFSGAPILLIVCMLISLFRDAYRFNGDVTTKFLIFSILYAGSTTILFLRFRRSGVGRGVL